MIPGRWAWEWIGRLVSLRGKRSGAGIIEEVDLADSRCREVVGERHGHQVKLPGEFVRHEHDPEDEMFLVVRGRFRIELRESSVVARCE